MKISIPQSPIQAKTIERKSKNKAYSNVDIEQIARACGRASRSNKDWVCSCPVPSHGKGRGDKTPSLSISLGDDGRFLAKCHASCSFEEILDALKSRGRIDHYSTDSSYKKEQPKPPPFSDHKKRQEHALRQALLIQNNSAPSEGTLVETYLRSRGLTVTPPETLRFHPNLSCWEKDANDKLILKGRYPAMIGCVQKWPGKEIVGVHRTYLTYNGQGKADIPSPKKMLGNCSGGAVRFPGESLECIAVSEGIESGLSYWQENPGITVWACLSTSGMKSVILPPPDMTPEVIVIADHDAGGLFAAKELARCLTTEGRKVFIQAPKPLGCDMNSILGRAGQ